MESPSEEHKEQAPEKVRIGIITVSDTRTLNDDTSGNMIKELARSHDIIKHIIVRDSSALIRNEIRDLVLESLEPVDVIILNGGTGVAKKDVTIEAVRPLLEKELTGFNSILAGLSYAKIGSAAMLSRATAGIYRGKVIFCLPGSPEACQLAMQKLVLPELGHIVMHLS